MLRLIHSKSKASPIARRVRGSRNFGRRVLIEPALHRRHQLAGEFRLLDPAVFTAGKVVVLSPRCCDVNSSRKVMSPFLKASKAVGAVAVEIDSG